MSLEICFCIFSKKNEEVKKSKFVQLIMKCIFNEYKSLHYHLSMTNDFMKAFLKGNFGNQTYNCMTMCNHSGFFYKTAVAHDTFLGAAAG